MKLRRESGTNEFRGSAYVEFDSEGAARAAVANPPLALDDRGAECRVVVLLKADYLQRAASKDGKDSTPAKAGRQEDSHQRQRDGDKPAEPASKRQKQAGDGAAAAAKRPLPGDAAASGLADAEARIRELEGQLQAEQASTSRLKEQLAEVRGYCLLLLLLLVLLLLVLLLLLAKAAACPPFPQPGPPSSWVATVRRPHAAQVRQQADNSGRSEKEARAKLLSAESQLGVLKGQVDAVVSQVNVKVAEVHRQYRQRIVDLEAQLTVARDQLKSEKATVARLQQAASRGAAGGAAGRTSPAPPSLSKALLADDEEGVVTLQAVATANGDGSPV